MRRQITIPNFWAKRSAVFWAKTLQTALLGLIVVVMLGAGQSRYDRLGNELMCSCGCGQILLECNHFGCPGSPVMIRELQAKLASGASDKAILGWFATKYGPIILAAPIRGGFDDAAWIVPFTVFVLATAGTFGIVWLWKRRAQGLVTAGAGVVDESSPQDAALRERIRRETEY